MGASGAICGAVSGGLVGLLDRRTLHHPRGKMAIETRVPMPIQQQVVRLALAHPFTSRELARIIQTCYALSIDSRGDSAGP